MLQRECFSECVRVADRMYDSCELLLLRHEPWCDCAQVELKPDLTATSFSAESSFFFATMSKLVYLPGVDVRLVLHGDGTSNGMGFKHFYWFEVGTYGRRRGTAVDAFEGFGTRARTI